MVVLNLAIGVTTPPLAINIFVAMRQTGATLAEVLKHLMPMIGLQILVAFIVTFVPWLSLALVG
jgi:C4-dicarboxylate transporter DctM subunit